MDIIYWVILVGWMAYLSFSVCCGLVSIDYLWIDNEWTRQDNQSSTQTNPSIFAPLVTGAECLRAPLPTPLHHVGLTFQITHMTREQEREHTKLVYYKITGQLFYQMGGRPVDPSIQ